MERELSIMCTVAIFAYGTLRQGFCNHDAFCSEAVSIQHAAVRGRLYEFSSGIPVLEVPDKDIIAHGSVDISKDIAVQQRLEARLPECLNRDSGDWQQIEGQLISLPDPARTLPPIDRLEGICPNGSSPYRRVLVLVKLSGGALTSAWCYVAYPAAARMLTPTFTTRWG